MDFVIQCLYWSNLVRIKGAIYTSLWQLMNLDIEANVMGQFSLDALYFYNENANNTSMKFNLDFWLCSLCSSIADCYFFSPNFYKLKSSKCKLVHILPLFWLYQEIQFRVNVLDDRLLYLCVPRILVQLFPPCIPLFISPSSIFRHRTSGLVWEWSSKLSFSLSWKFALIWVFVRNIVHYSLGDFIRFIICICSLSGL